MPAFDANIMFNCRCSNAWKWEFTWNFSARKTRAKYFPRTDSDWNKHSASSAASQSILKNNGPDIMWRKLFVMLKSKKTDQLTRPDETKLLKNEWSNFYQLTFFIFDINFVSYSGFQQNQYTRLRYAEMIWHRLWFVSTINFWPFEVVYFDSIKSN